MKYGLSISFCDPNEYCALAKAAEERGFSWATLSDHLFYPQTMSVPYPYTPDGKPRFTDLDPFPDPWTAITAMAQHTKTLQFYTNVFILPARNAILTAKQLATTSIFAGGRITIGVGMGWMPEEFAASGQPFKRRGKHADEMLEVMKKLWTGEFVEHHGEFYDFDPVRMMPKPEKQIPIFIGGISEPAMRRAAKHDGWISDLHTSAELEALMLKVFAYRAELGLPREGFQVSCFNPIDAFTPESHAHLEAIGVTTLTTLPWALQAMTEGEVSLKDKIKSLDDYARTFDLV
jgi:probable F420-dependent oxidoreductase